MLSRVCMPIDAISAKPSWKHVTYSTPGATTAAAAAAPIPSRVRITACALPTGPLAPAGTVDMMLYPEALLCTRSTEQRATLEQSREAAAAAAALARVGIPTMPVPYEHLVLVCTHNSRSRRCGRTGPQVQPLQINMKVIEAMQERKAQLRMSDTQLSIVACSHIGGHKHAGVCIVWPQGHWYGRLTKENAADIVDTCVEHKRVQAQPPRLPPPARRPFPRNEHRSVRQKPPIYTGETASSGTERICGESSSADTSSPAANAKSSRSNARLAVEARLGSDVLLLRSAEGAKPPSAPKPAAALFFCAQCSASAASAAALSAASAAAARRWATTAVRGKAACHGESSSRSEQVYKAANSNVQTVHHECAKGSLTENGRRGLGTNVDAATGELMAVRLPARDALPLRTASIAAAHHTRQCGMRLASMH
ncbi:Sucrase/ferredoxin-like-domain-containing protein [Tribonema minus]|uniref:Sucrase/ferredoxin-like-domain-containing protein n=1 Tax=Tribonema minus TaxID=303371 RepID=A0A835YVK0_9STRA|nr:Sucrase/ferredoxin-like-domain-containing protein [Tribonema minus]